MKSVISIDALIRSRRKTISIEITAAGKLIIRAPFRTSFAYIQKLVREKQGWIIAKQKEILERLKSRPKFADGEHLLFLGKGYPLEFDSSISERVKLTDTLIVRSAGKEGRADLVNWYKQKADKIIPQRCQLYSRKTGYHPAAIKITNAQKRWGSCSANGNLNFSWRLILAPLEVIDYVVVHELVHLEIKSHSRRYWDKVKAFFPDYKAKRDWLRENETRLSPWD